MSRLIATLGDITKIEVDAIVNAANSALAGGGGVDGAIHAAGGPAILAECRQIVAKDGPLATGRAVVTTAGDLPARILIHTVGPIWGRMSEVEADHLLASSYRSSLDLAATHSARSIAFPNISTGVYGYPKPRAASVAIEAVSQWVDDGGAGITEINFVCFGEDNYQLYQARLPD